MPWFRWSWRGYLDVVHSDGVKLALAALSLGKSDGSWSARSSSGLLIGGALDWIASGTSSRVQQ